MNNRKPEQKDAAGGRPARRSWTKTIDTISRAAFFYVPPTLFAVLFVGIFGAMIFDVVHTSTEERVSEDAANRAVGVIRNHDGSVSRAGDVLGSGEDTTLADKLTKEFEGDNVRLSASSLSARSVYLEHGDEGKVIVLGSSPEVHSGSSLAGFFVESWEEPSGDARRVAEVATEHSRKHDLNLSTQDLIDTRSDDDELPDAIDEEFDGNPPEIGWEDQVGLEVKSADREDFVYVNPSPDGRHVPSGSPDEVELLRTEE